MNNLLFSIAVLSYNNCDYLFDCLKSILEQDYERIELLVSDDSSKSFEKELISDFIQKNKKANIERYSVWHQPINLGTVAHAEFCRHNAKGDLLYLIAADDVLANSHVVSRFCIAANAAQYNIAAISGQVMMCNLDLSYKGYNWASKLYVDIIRSNDSSLMFSKLSHRSFIPTTGTCYKMSFLNDIGGFDKSYKLIEDVPTFAKAMRKGFRICWIDKVIIARHRDGGLVHKEPNNYDEVYRTYLRDRLFVFKIEFFPYIAQIHESDIEIMLRRWYWYRSSYERAHCSGITKKVLTRIRHNTLAVIIYSVCIRGENTVRFSSLKAFADLATKHIKLSCQNYRASLVRILKKLRGE